MTCRLVFLLGVNNHFLSIILAGVLVRDDQAESFEWVFAEFLTMMGGPTDCAHYMPLQRWCLLFHWSESVMLTECVGNLCRSEQSYGGGNQLSVP